MTDLRATPGNPFRPSARMFNRFADAADAVLGARTITGVPDAPGFSGSRFAPYIVTEVDGYTNVIIIGAPLGNLFAAKRAEGLTPFTEAGDDVDIYFRTTTGFVCTGQTILVASVNGELQVVGGQVNHNFTGNAAADIAAGDVGEIEVSYLDHNGDSQTAIGSAVNLWGRGIVTGQVVYGDLINSTLYIFDAGCDV